MPIQDLENCADALLVGGKAANLGSLLRAGFVVPDGFVMTTAAQDDDLNTIRSAYRKLSAPAVAVRSSATIEDNPERSTAGQFKTVLNVRSEEELMEAVRVCRASSDSPSVRAYLGDSLAARQVSMAVVVQRQVSADSSGVLFTQAPKHPEEMLIEAVPGLGADLVSGKRQPDTFRVSANSGQIIDCTFAEKAPSLTRSDVMRLWSLGREIASHFDCPQDIEWAISGTELFVLQSRPITTSDRTTSPTTRIEEVRQELASSGRGPWVLHNLAETLPHPTPLTWSILQQFMSGSGGFGAIYRRLGFEPKETGFLKLILGRIYTDLSRAPGLFGKKFPFAYDLERLRDDPDAALAPPSLPRGSCIARFSARRRLAEAERRINRESVDFDRTLSEQIVPDFVSWCTEEKKRDLSQLSPEEWITLWHEREERVFSKFAPEIFFTSLIAANALQRLQEFVAENFWSESPETLTQLLASTGAPDQTILANTALREVSQGHRSLEAWLKDYGHRAMNEFDLAAPRWREMPDALLAYASRLKDAADPLESHRRRTELAGKRICEMPAPIARDLCERADFARRYLIFRENGKHYLMLGYDLLRDMVIDASRRLNVEASWLTFDELTAALRDANVLRPADILRRKRDYQSEARIVLPRVIDSAALSTLGQIPNLEDRAHLKGFAISSGFASGPVRIVESPLDHRELGVGYVLVCPSTDPQWTPLFLNASALVVGCGGSLSHGAIVAREMNLPAVVLPDATRLLHEGEQIFVDGSIGVVSREAEPELDLNDTWVAPEQRPPVAGKCERRAARIRNAGFILWSLNLIAVWFLPKNWLHQPSLHALDALLWPLVVAVGRPASVAVIGTGLALLAATVQALLADNKRVSEARRRARGLTNEAAALAANSPRRAVLTSIAAAVHSRVIGTSLVSLGLLLGVFVLIFTWLAARMDQTNPAPGSLARVQATIDADFREPIALEITPPLHLDASSPQTRLLPAIRETLERLPAQQHMSDSELADLKGYLNRGVPPQTLSWFIRSDQPGSYPIAITLGKRTPLYQHIVFGDQSPPPDTQILRNDPLHSVKVEKTEQDHGASIHLLNRRISWPWIYLATYLTSWLMLRRLWRLV